MTQEQLAESAGLDVKTVRKAEQGKRLDLGTITKLCFALQTDLRHLVQPGRSAADREIRQRDVVISWQRAFNARGLDGLLRCYHEEAVLHLPGAPQIPFGGTFRGHKAIRGASQLLWKTCDTQLLDDKDYKILVAGDTAVVQGQQGLRLPDGRHSSLHYVQVLQFADDRIVDHRVDYDTLNVARLLQL
jgi:ketosteroid isomerase-like protein